MDIIDSLSSALSDPNLAYVLLMLAILSISVEVFTPGVFFAGTIGIIAGLLAFVALTTLPVNPLGLVLIIISLGFFVAEAFVHTRRILTITGMIFIIFGSIFLFSGGADNRANPFLIFGMTAVMSVTLGFLVNRAATAQSRRIATGNEAIEGSVVVARTTLNPNGMVLYQGELWQAQLNEGSAAIDEELIVTGIQGLKLYVTKKKKGVN
jgi:membrane-bound serine protease (ClpP class)